MTEVTPGDLDDEGTDEVLPEPEADEPTGAEGDDQGDEPDEPEPEPDEPVGDDPS